LAIKLGNLHPYAMNRGFGGWVSSFIIVCYGYVWGRPLARLCALNPDSPTASTAFVANIRFVPACLLVGRQKLRSESSET